MKADIKDIKKDLIHAVVKTTFEPQSKEFGGKLVTTMGAYITVEGREYNVYFKEKYFGLAKPGAKLLGMKKLYQGKPYWEWYQDVKDEHSYEAPNAPNPGESDFSAPTPIKGKEPDWDAIAEGKTRCAIAVAFIGQGKNVSEEVKEEINKWVKFIITGK